MNVLFVSQCHGRALPETRRILDQFAERRGERSWQTPITLEGLNTVRKLLRQKARRNTAVACFWLHKGRSELLWIVGNAREFNERGATPTNSTRHDLLRRDNENDWRHGEIIRLLAALAALFHDFGKASTRFQGKLRHNHRGRDAYRHEWVSLRLFQAFVGEAENDDDWLARLAALEQAPKDWAERLLKDGLVARPPAPLPALPPLARAVGWLIVSHHRLPVPPEKSTRLRRIEARIDARWCGADPQAERSATEAVWQFDNGLPWDSRHWRAHASKLATRLLRHPGRDGDWLGNPHVAHLARLALMLADHYYSGQPSHARYGDADYPLYANTGDDGALKQRLDEHLIGVEVASARIVRSLPRLARELPRIARHKGFRKRTALAPFKWQNKAFDLAEGLRQRSERQGFFGVNMASTGTGKTIANGRILYGLSNPTLGARFTLALGLRVLTLQTGKTYRERLHLDDSDLAVLVGGAARALHEQGRAGPGPVPGSESARSLLDDGQHIHYEGRLEDGPLNRWLDGQARKLLMAPVVACTIDHLAPATEGVRGGRQILPMLRLLTADLVIDEVDDFDTDDLHAITRLVHWAGLLGSRVLLSSATLPPALVAGLFQAYREGRTAWQQSRGEPGQPVNICCVWFDEFGATHRDCPDTDGFRQGHDAFVARRVKKLGAKPQRLRAEILPVEVRDDETLMDAWARTLREGALRLHHDNPLTDPASGKRFSIGLIRMAHIDRLVDTAQALLAQGMPENTRLHLLVYHSRFPLFVRAHIEKRLDSLLQRADEQAIFKNPTLRQALDSHEEKDHLFVVLASPVAEVGRDHDYDWAIVEPSSMRSIIQLAGRIRRHRRGEWQAVNLLLLDRNLKALESRFPAFAKPGYESPDYPLDSHALTDLLRPEELARIDARPRILPADPLAPKSRLADLEHKVLADLMLDGGPRRPVTEWYETRAHLSAALQKMQPFRRGTPMSEYILLPDDDGELMFHSVEDDGHFTPQEGLRERLETPVGERAGWWGEWDDASLLETYAEGMDMEPESFARRFARIELDAGVEQWNYHPMLGFQRRR